MRAIRILTILMLITGIAVADDVLYPANSEIEISYTLSSLELRPGDTLIVTRSLINNSDDVLNNLYWAENLPTDVDLVSSVINVNGNQISNYLFELEDDYVYEGYIAYHWVIDEPYAGDTYNYKVNSEGSAELIYKVIFPDEGNYTLPFHTLCFDNGNSGSYTIADPITINVVQVNDEGNIEGTITNTDSQPVQYAYVTINQTGVSCSSAVDGRYIFPDVQAGTYSLTVTHPGYRDTVVNNVIVYAEQTTTRNIILNVLIGDEGNIGGTITDTGFRPIQDAHVVINQTGESCSSAVDGKYYFADVQAGTYSLTVTHTGYRDTTVNNVTVYAGQTATRDVILRAPIILYIPGDINSDGVIIGSDVTFAVNYFRGRGAPPPDSFWLESKEIWFYAAADANGDCRFIGSDVTYLVGYFRMINREMQYCPEIPPVTYGLDQDEVLITKPPVSTGLRTISKQSTKESIK